jgi:hypothetical protein
VTAAANAPDLSRRSGADRSSSRSTRRRCNRERPQSPTAVAAPCRSRGGVRPCRCARAVSRAWAEVGFAERHRLRDPQAAAPEHDHQSAEPVAVEVVACLAHHGDDLFHGRRVGGIELPLVAGRASGVVAGYCRGRATPPATSSTGETFMGSPPIAQRGISSHCTAGQSPLPYRRSRMPGQAASRPSSSSRFAGTTRTPGARRPDAWPSSISKVWVSTVETLVHAAFPWSPAATPADRCITIPVAARRPLH